MNLTNEYRDFYRQKDLHGGKTFSDIYEHNTLSYLTLITWNIGLFARAVAATVAEITMTACSHTQAHSAKRSIVAVWMGKKRERKNTQSKWASQRESARGQENGTDENESKK